MQKTNSPLFTILCKQRSGSHLLATALNSHPDIACLGELDREDVFISEVSGRVVGGIVMYGKPILPYGKIIHLVRDPVACARSNIVNHMVKESHYTEETNITVDEIPDNKVREKARQIKQQQNTWRRGLVGQISIEISYEELTGGKNVASLTEGVSHTLCDFLGVKRQVLTTPLRKPVVTFK